MKSYFVCPNCGIIDRVSMYGHRYSYVYVDYVNDEYDWDTYEEEKSEEFIITEIECTECEEIIYDDIEIPSYHYNIISKYQVTIDGDDIKIGEHAKENLIEYLNEHNNQKIEYTDEALKNAVKTILLEKKLI